MRLLLILALSATAFGQSKGMYFSVNSNDCTAKKTCGVRVYRAAAACPASGIGNMTYTQIFPTLTASPQNNGTTWTVFDSTSGMAVGSHYCYYATVTFTSGGQPSSPSNTLSSNIGKVTGY